MLRQQLTAERNEGSNEKFITFKCTAVIRSSDPDSRIYVNGEYMGTGQGHANSTDQKVAFSKNNVEIRKDGCAVENYSFRRSQEADVGAIVGGILWTVPFLWVAEYKPYHGYDF